MEGGGGFREWSIVLTIVSNVVALASWRRSIPGMLSSDSRLVTRMIDPPLLIEVVDRLMDGGIEHDGIAERLVSEMVTLQVAPAQLNVVKFRCVTRQPLDVDPTSCRERGGTGFRGVDRPIVEHQYDRFRLASWPRSEAGIKLFQQSDEIGTSFRCRGMHDEFAGRRVEHPHHCHLTCLTGRFNAQVGPSFGPGVGEVRMGQGLRLISIKQNDVAGPGLLAPDLETQSNAVDFVRVLPPFQRVSRAAPAEPPFCLSRVLRREREIRMPVWRSISAHNRGNVQLVRFSTGSRSKALATARARSPLSADGPGARVERNASTPPSANHCRQWRTESAVTPNASAILGLLQPANVRRMARPLSASPRSSEPASSERADFCSSVALNGDRLLIVTTQSESRMATSLPMCDRSRNLA